MIPPVYLRYVAVSVGALGFDMSLFLAGLAVGIAALPASVAGYSAGIAVHWLASSRLVFGDRLAGHGAGRRRQQALFVVSAVAGLAVTAAIVGAGQYAGVPPLASKLAGIAAGFQLTYALRRKMVFA
ncbi:GtrA family protein [Sphingosinicella sp. BN140058]|uniref:GtrA family protein n=1 Tax=Sphingosinicella sp. BN140058 TaxID=1892855 RepID=UPI001012BC47|nr:GtrA family protein [Sphingosinicella sp. BN140058]QAY75432.1 GtrA family protein [Sphingosinicella sp. BN140058]